jgi:hypothetical protein
VKTKLQCVFIMLVLPGEIHQAAAQTARLFRLSGPAATRIIAFQSNAR